MKRPDRRSAGFPIGASLTAEDLAGDLHPHLHRLRSVEPVSWVPAIGGWLVTSHELVSDALRRPDAFTVDDPRFSTGRVLGPSMLSTEGEAQRRHRRPFVPHFGPRAVESDHRAGIEADGDRIVADLMSRPADVDGRGRAELRTELAGPLAVSVIARALGLSTEPERLLAWYRGIVTAVLDTADGRPIGDESAAAVAGLRRAVEQDRTPDSMLDRVAVEGGLDPDEVFSNAAVALFGAIETSEGMTANALLQLLSTPNLLDRVRAEPALLERVVDESLRFEPAAAVVDRYATADLRFGPGTDSGGNTGKASGPTADIEAGDLVVLSLAGANRDPSVFDEPDRFDPDRPNAGRHLAFVVGPHACIGLHLARLETVAALAAVIRGLPDVRLESATAPHGSTFRKPDRVDVSFSPA